MIVNGLMMLRPGVKVVVQSQVQSPKRAGDRAQADKPQAKASSREILPLLHPPADLRGGPVHPDRAAGGDRAVHAADRAISRDHAADGLRHGHYPGASAETVANTVATPLEEEINGVENMLYMSAQCSSDGQMRLAVTFKVGTDPNTAQVLVQNRVDGALPRLPEDVRTLGVITRKRSPSIAMLVSLISPSGKYDPVYLSNYAYLHVRDVLARLPGVGDSSIFGARDYCMRIWLDPNKASARNLTASDIVAAIRQQNVQVAAGLFGQAPQPPDNLFQLAARPKGG